MEAFATLSFVGNVIQLVEVSSKLVKTAIELRNSAAALPNDINDVIAIRNSLASMLQRIETTAPIYSEHDRDLAALASNCRRVCGELLDQVNHIKGKGDSSKTGAFGVAWRTLTDGGKLNSIQQKLDRYRSQILTHIVVMLDHKQSATHALIASSIEQQSTHARSLRTLIDKNKEDVIRAINSELNNVQPGKGRADAKPIQDTEPNTSRFERTTPERLEREPLEPQLNILATVRNALTAIEQASETITIQDWLFYPDLLSREGAIHNAYEKTVLAWRFRDVLRGYIVESYGKS
ncbi:hypothetical protein O1611_g2747 [Lasiodiplodia mahajangana]|uniref:Uncharacterized protein n=1 Tax=Lasiodiplodia mahajangana TaxID=1108764 RepID=A0ACC2JU03_9PEZI|nr:hypothetical protein O1611_g2747 [Lasiodiplodia mahajangana]